MEMLYPVADDQAEDNRSVTVLIHCAVSASEQEAFLGEVKTHLEAFNQTPGVLGSHVFRQEEGEWTRVTVVERFASAADHKAWLQSPAFVEWRKLVGPAQMEKDAVHRYYGLETLFSIGKAGSPPQWKLAIVLFFAVLPGTYAMALTIGPALDSIPPLVAPLVTSAIMVIAMTYVLVPVAMRIFQRFLNG